MHLHSQRLGAISSPCAALAQLVRALDCGSRGPPFEPGRRYHPPAPPVPDRRPSSRARRVEATAGPRHCGSGRPAAAGRSEPPAACRPRAPPRTRPAVATSGAGIAQVATAATAMPMRLRMARTVSRRSVLVSSISVSLAGTGLADPEGAPRRRRGKPGRSGGPVSAGRARGSGPVPRQSRRAKRDRGRSRPRCGAACRSRPGSRRSRP